MKANYDYCEQTPAESSFLIQPMLFNISGTLHIAHLQMHIYYILYMSCTHKVSYCIQHTYLYSNNKTNLLFNSFKYLCIIVSIFYTYLCCYLFPSVRLILCFILCFFFLSADTLKEFLQRSKTFVQNILCFHQKEAASLQHLTLAGMFGSWFLLILSMSDFRSVLCFSCKLLCIMLYLKEQYYKILKYEKEALCLRLNFL